MRTELVRDPHSLPSMQYQLRNNYSLEAPLDIVTERTSDQLLIQ